MSMTEFKRLTDETLMPWGKHKGEMLKDVPANYLLWLEGQNIKKTERSDFINGLLVYVDQFRDVIEFQANNEKSKYRG